MAQLAQAYLHLKPYKASRKKLSALVKVAEALSADAAKRIYDGGVTIDVELEEGSLVVRVTVIGLLAGHLALESYSKIADYKGFKESVVELCNDAREFAVDVCEPFQKKAGATKDQVYRFERRLKTPGKLNRLVRRLAHVESSLEELSHKDLKKELSELQRQLALIAEDLSVDELSAVERRLTTQGLPPPSRWPQPSPGIPKIAKKEEQLEFDGRLGAPIPVLEPVLRAPRFVYRNRISIEQQLPKLHKRDRSESSFPFIERPDE
ncbi:hypothetical protein [Tardiphaga sp. 42S5]|uniref:hypothetical protein n=1 Tax=Tardiphaga sp. 42S5 TaxID=1404799 RepID=UPI002A598FF3|nr:hypothetical protein [Tardiphaga sp. 42S5]WPO43119.1 hypothetical protein SFY93_08210 [Tardiphaga sp. 42S5]